MKKIALIDYGSGNIHSAFKALQRAGNDIAETKVFVTSKASDLENATHIVLPGVGAFADCYKGVTEISGMLEAIKENIFTKQKPFLGICVGMQLLAEKGFENGEHKGFGFIKGEVKKFDFSTTEESFREMQSREISDLQNTNQISQGFASRHDSSLLKIPHMGWNNVKFKPSAKLFKNIEQNSDFYFVHSYYFDTEEENIAAKCNYGFDFCASIEKDNIFGVQFHPEKSQSNGLKLLANFISL